MSRHPHFRAYLALVSVCFFWGTTYLGIRMSLGASAGRLELKVIREALVLSAIGSVSGLAGLLAVSRFIAGLLTQPLETADAWLAGAQKHEGSWWTNLAAWLGARSGESIPAPPVGSAAHPPIDDAPGTYVLEK